MGKRKKVLLAAAGLGALAAAATGSWWLLGAGVKVERCGFLPWPLFGTCDPDFTIVERHARKLDVRRVTPEGALRTLGTHDLTDSRLAGVTPGVGFYYAISTSGRAESRECRVYDAGREIYSVPVQLLSMGYRVLSPLAVLAGGRLLVTYRGRGTPTSPPMDRDVRFLAILTREGKQFVSHPLVSGSEQCLALAISGDGTVVAVSLGPLADPKLAATHTLVYSARDLKPLATIEGFTVRAINHDGSVMVGGKGSGLAAYRNGQLLAERADCKSLYVQISWDGEFVYAVRGSQLAEVMETERLKPIVQVHAEPGYNPFTGAVSDAGCLAVAEQTLHAAPGQPIRSRLRVYRKDGSVALSHELSLARSYAITAVHWTRDGRTVYYYLSGGRGRVVRCPLP